MLGGEKELLPSSVTALVTIVLQMLRKILSKLSRLNCMKLMSSVFTGKIVAFRLSNFIIFNHYLYRSSIHSLVEASKNLEQLINKEKATLITGDFNVCYKQNRGNPITDRLGSLGFKQIVTKATHVMGGLIDHAYWYESNSIWEEPIVEIYSPYYSDHDGILITMKKSQI